jgi:uncharacterized protein
VKTLRPPSRTSTDPARTAADPTRTTHDPARTTHDPARTTHDPAPPQHRLATSVLLHLLPGIALTLFIVLAAPTVESLGFPVVFALFAGIGLVIVPLELGYLLAHAKRTTGTFSLQETVGYREKLPRRTFVRWTAALTVWFLLWLVISTAFVDRWLADALFSWMPDELLQFSRVSEVGEPIATTALVILVVVAFVLNGVVGPVVEELYFRGHLLPRIERFGRGAPVLNTVLFLLYHLWTPWQVPLRVVGLLPTVWMTWRTRSLRLSIAVHVTINLLFLTAFLAAFVAGSS